jgi:hypothetical protein
VTKSFKDLVQTRAARDPVFAAALLRERIDTMPTGEVDTGKREHTRARGMAKMNIETEFPTLNRDGAMATAAAIAFYQDGYDIVVNRVVAARGPKEFLGQRPCVRRFCSKMEPEVTFESDAHAISELAGNVTLLSLYECHTCNTRFSAFEDDLGKFTVLERLAGQVRGKKRVCLLP